jgi:predicted nucleotidyltransferase
MVTAQDLARTLRTRSAQRRARAAARALRLRQLLLPAARLLVQRYHANHVLLFGSLADGTFSETSDVDLAVVGMPKGQYFDALADLMRLFGGPVDLVRIEEAPASLRECIEREGQPL